MVLQLAGYPDAHAPREARLMDVNVGNVTYPRMEVCMVTRIKLMERVHLRELTAVSPFDKPRNYAKSLFTHSQMHTNRNRSDKGSRKIYKE